MSVPDEIKLEALRKIAFGDLAGARELLNKYKEENKNENNN